MGKGHTSYRRVEGNVLALSHKTDLGFRARQSGLSGVSEANGVEGRSRRPPAAGMDNAPDALRLRRLRRLRSGHRVGFERSATTGKPKVPARRLKPRATDGKATLRQAQNSALRRPPSRRRPTWQRWPGTSGRRAERAQHIEFSLMRYQVVTLRRRDTVSFDTSSVRAIINRVWRGETRMAMTAGGLSLFAS